ncbi:hypothetical protein D3C77_184110 [compost metagenome]|uniref:hypothetical protein n=2 Tax=Pseudomonas TaxID=286 RepID=UPI00048D49F4|nr:hypothetical protein [Pseudomonas vranovensis]
MASKLMFERVIGAAVKPVLGAVFVAIEDRIQRLQRMIGTLDAMHRLDFEALCKAVEAAEAGHVASPAPEQAHYNKQLNHGLATVAAFFLGLRGQASGRAVGVRQMTSSQSTALSAKGVGKLERRVAFAEAGIKAVGTWLTAKTPEEKAEGYGGALGGLLGARVGAAIGRRGGAAGTAAGEMVGSLAGEGVGSAVAKRWFTEVGAPAPRGGNTDKGPCCTFKPHEEVPCVACPAPAATAALPANPAVPLLLASAALGAAVIKSKTGPGEADAGVPPHKVKDAPAPPESTPAEAARPARPARAVGRTMLGAAPLALLESGIKVVDTFMTAETREQKAEGYGGAIGGLGGALLGAAVGSVIPVIGPPVGAAIGALLFGMAGDKLGSNLAKRWFAGSDQQKPAAGRTNETAKADRVEPGALVRAQAPMAPVPRLMPLLTRMGSMAPPATAGNALPSPATAQASVPPPPINQQFNFTSNMPITVQGCMTDPVQLAQTIEPMVRRQFEALIRQATSRQLYDVPHVA